VHCASGKRNLLAAHHELPDRIVCRHTIEDPVVRAAGSIVGVSHLTVARPGAALKEKFKVRVFDRI
jgi:hypothetical protein